MASTGNLGLGKATAAGSKVKVVRVDGVVKGLPVLALPGNNAQDVHGVDLLERALLGLVDEEEGDQDTQETAASKDVTVLVADGASDPGSEEGDEEVPEPVGRSAKSHGDGTVARGEHLADNGPDKGTPLL